MKRSAKRLLGLTLSLAMALSLIPATAMESVANGIAATVKSATVTAVAAPAGETGAEGSSTNSANAAAFGFNTQAPADFNAGDGLHPFGISGTADKTNLMPVREISLMTVTGDSYTASGSTRVFNYDTETIGNGSLFSAVSNYYTGENFSTAPPLYETSLSVTEGNNPVYHMASGVAYDPTGSGRDDHVFYYGLPEISGGSYQSEKPYDYLYMEDYSYTGGRQGAHLTAKLDYSNDTNHDAYLWSKTADENSPDKYLSVTAGDFNGDGKETVVIYDPEYGSLSLEEYSPSGGSLGKVSSYNVGEVNLTSRSGGSPISLNNGWAGGEYGADYLPLIHLTAGDLDGDHKDELVVTISPIFSGTLFYTYSSASTVLILSKGADGNWEQDFSRTLGMPSDYALCASASVIGDINNDNQNEIITVGSCISDYTGKASGYGCTITRYSSGGWSAGGYDDNLTSSVNSGSSPSGAEIYTVPSVGLVRLYGTGNQQPYLFVNGEFFTYSSDTSFEQSTAKSLGLGNAKVRQPIIGNFDGNAEGREQILVACTDSNGLRIMGMGIFKSGGTKNCFWRCNADALGRTVLTAPDADTDDGLVVRYTGKDYEYTNPEVMAVLLASPYFEDLLDEYENVGATGFGTSKGTEHAASSTATNSVGAYVSFEQDISLFGLIDIASFEFETAYNYEWSQTNETSTSYTTSISFETGSGSNQVVLICTPAIVYHYDVLGTDGKVITTNDVTVAQKPCYITIPVEDYNASARRLGNPVIDNSSVMDVVPGQPLTYPSTKAEIDSVGNVATSEMPVAAGYGSVVVGYEIATEQSASVTQEYSHNVEVKSGGGVVGFKVGATYGHSWGGGTTETNTSGVTRSGSVANIPAGNTDYSLTWQFATWDITVGEGQRQYTVPVMGYLVSNVSQPPSVPQDLTAMPDQNSVTLTWDHGHSSAVEYEIFRYFPDDTGAKYYSVGTVNGSEDTFVYQGLNPGTRYYFSIRAVGADGLCSKYAEPVMVTTSSASGLPRITTQPASQSVAVGANVTFSTEAIPTSGSIGYIWQSRESSTGKWVTLTDETTKTLTLSGVTADMAGTQYRCMISQVDGGESATFVYTDIATLTVGKYDTTTALTLSSSMGYADHAETQTSEQTVIQNVTETKGGTTYTKYKNTYARTSREKPYVYSAEGKFWLPSTLSAEGTLTPETNMTALTALGDQVVNESGVVAADRAMEQKTAFAYLSANAEAPVQCKVYTATVYTVTATPGENEGETTYSVTGTKNDVTLYEYTPSGGTGYYTGATDPKSGKLVLTQLTATDSDNGFTAAGTYYLRSSLAEVWTTTPATETAESGTYKVYTRTDGSSLYEKNGTFYTKSEGTYTAVEANTYFATAGLYGVVTTTEAGMTVSSMVQIGAPATKEVAQDVPYIVYKDGDPVRLTATVKKADGNPASGSVSFQITNTATGAVTTETVTLSSGVATTIWTPTVAGVYTVKAVYSGSTTMNPSSSDSATYYAKKAESIYEIVLDSSLLYGNVINPMLQQRPSTDQANAISSATFAVYGYNSKNGKYDIPCENWNTVPLVPGEYQVDAYVPDNTEPVAQKVFTVTKRPITISAPEITGVSEGTTVDLSDYVDQIKYTEADGTTYNNLEDNYKALFTLTGVSGSLTSGNYDISVAYRNSGAEDATQFRARYLPTFEKSVLTVAASAVSITFSAGENGTVTGYELGDSTTTTFTSPYSLSKGSDVRFAPTPASGFAVSRWTIDGTPVTSQEISNGTFDEYGTVSLEADNALRIGSVQKNMTVKVEFSNATHTVSYTYTGGGSVTATQGGTVLSSPSTVVEGSSVTLTAAPNPGYVVKFWSVSRDGGIAAEEKNPDGTNYTGTTLTLDNIDANLAVHVEFEQAESFEVTYGAVDTNGNPAAAGLVTLTAAGLDENGWAQKGSTVTLTASALQPGTGIQRWEVSTDGRTWETKAASITEYTIYSLQADTQVRLVLQTSTASYTVKYSISGKNDSDTSAGSLTAKTGDTGISSDSSCIAYSALVFTYTEPKDYEFVGWEVTGTTGTEASDGTTHTYTISSLNADTTVTAVVQKKPLINISNLTNGTIDVKVSGTETSIANGTYVYSGTDLTVTVTPDDNYVVNTINAGSTTIFNGDKTNGAKSNATSYKVSDDTTFTATLTEKPTVTIASGITNGTVTFSGTKSGQTVTKDSADYHVDFGSTVTITATPNSGYVASDITVNSSKLLENNRTNGAQTQITTAVNADVSISATFLAKPKVTIASGLTGGSISVTGTVDGTPNTAVSDNDYVDFGSIVTVTATPTGDENSNYVVKNIKSNGAEILTGDKTNGAKSQTITVGTTDAQTTYAVTGEFLEKPVVTITNSPANGTVEVKGTVNGSDAQTLSSGSHVDFGSALTVTLAPATGYEVGSITGQNPVYTDDGHGTTTDNKTYTISDVQADQNINAVWASIPTYSLTLSAETIDAGGAHGSISANVTRKGMDDYAQSNVTNSGTFYRDSDLEIVATGASGYRVQSYSWTINGVSGNGETLPNLTNVQGDVSITVRFVQMNAGVTFGPTATTTEGGYISSATGAGTDYLPNADSGVNLGNGATLTLGVTVQPGYEVEGWYKTVGGVETAIEGTEGVTSYNYTSDGTTSAIYLSVKFRQVEYAVTCAASSAAGGTVSANITGSKARGGQTVTFTALPNPGYTVTGWTVNGEDVTDSDGNPNTLVWTVPNGKAESEPVTGYEIKALFDLDTYTVSYSQPVNGSLTATVDNDASVAGNTVVTFTATPNEHYEVESWTVNDEVQTGQTGNTLKVTVTADTIVAVTFQPKQYTVTLTQPGEGGSATADKASPVTANTEVTFTAAPNTGYELKEWLVNGVSTAATAENALTLTVTGNTTVQPVFKKTDLSVTYTLTGTEGAITATANGSTVSSGGTVPYGSSVTLTVAPTTSTDMVSYWKVNGTVVAEMTATADAPMEYTIANVTAAQTVEVELVTRPTYTVSATAGGGGSVAITGDTENTGSITVSRNGSVTVTATENSYYQFKEWLVNGVKANETGCTLTLSDIKDDTTVKAVFFEAGLFKVMFEDVTAYSGAASIAITADGTAINPGPNEGSSVSVVGGSELVFKATPASGYMVKEWTVNGVVQDNLSNTLTIDKLTENTTVTVEFEPLVLRAIPASGTDYTITNIIKNPEDYGGENEIRDRGDVTFKVVPESGKTIASLTPSAGTATRNDDGSYTVTVKNVTANITLTANVTAGIPLTVNGGANGTLTVKRGDQILTTGAVLQAGDVLTITAAPASGYQLSSLTVNGSTFSSGSTYTVAGNESSIMIASAFTKTAPPSGGGGGGGGALLTETVVLKDSTSGKITVSDAYAEKGDTVTLTVTPDEGYALEELTVTDSNGTEIALTAAGTNKYTFTMPASTVSVKATFAAIDTVCDGGTDCPAYHFADVNTDAWYHEAVDYVIENGIMNGIGNDQFAPNSTLQRSMLMTMLARMDGVDTDGGATWYEKGMQWAVANGISDGTNPDSNITREQIAAMLYRYAQLKGYDTSERGSLDAFGDGAKTSSWAVESMQWAVGSGLLQGSNGMLNPTGNATRAEVAQMLLNFNEWMQSTK